jgi:hypothetical protein
LRRGTTPGNTVNRITLCCLVLLLLSVVLSAGCSSEAKLSAREVLRRSVENLLALKSYHYGGTSSMTAAGDPRLDNEATFETVLKLNVGGALDGHMVVKSPTYSYETYSYDGVEYARVKGGAWYRVERGATTPGYGMVSLGSRKIIAQFADLAEDVRLTGETGNTYTVSLVMGEKYHTGAAAIAGTSLQEMGSAASAGRDTDMTLVVGKKDMRIRRVVMTDAKEPGGVASVTTKTAGNYSDFDAPVDVVPPPEALNAPPVDASEAAPTQQPQ